MNWTEPTKPNKESGYDHVTCDTPLGTFFINWKGWKENDTYSITIGDEWIGWAWNLEQAKLVAREWLTNKNKELADFLEL